MADVYFAIGFIGGLYALMNAIAALFERHINLFWWLLALACGVASWYGAKEQLIDFEFNQIPEIIIRAIAMIEL